MIQKEATIGSLFDLDYEPSPESCVRARAIVSPPSPPPRPAQSMANPALAARFRKLAEGMDKEIERRRNSWANSNLTRKRLEEQRSNHAEADRLEAQQKILRALADGWDQPVFPLPLPLAVFKTKEDMRRLANLARRAEHRYEDRAGDGFYYDFEMWNRSERICLDRSCFDEARQWVLCVLEGKGDTALAKERKLALEEKRLAMQGIPDFFPTPQAVIEEMMRLADIREGQVILEPSAGSGTLAEAIRSVGAGKIELWCLEINYDLRKLLIERGFRTFTEHNDFLEHGLEPSGFGYDRIIMNPPFSSGLDIIHVQHAYSLLNRGGRLVSVMATGWQTSVRKASVEFANWFWQVGGRVVELPSDAFEKGLRPTGVSTCLVVIDK